MVTPQSSPESFPKSVKIDKNVPSSEFITLLTNARQEYVWEKSIIESQKTIINLEKQVATYYATISQNIDIAKEIALEVVKWGGGKPPAIESIKNMNGPETEILKDCIVSFRQGTNITESIVNISDLPGISLVFASKIFRFVNPEKGASVDRHASYFFNSLGITSFKREWSTGKHNASRMANFNPNNLSYNCNIYIKEYLTGLKKIADFLNASKNTYRCPVRFNEFMEENNKIYSVHRRNGAFLNDTHTVYPCAVLKADLKWRPTDVEMAAFHWWAENGAK